MIILIFQTINITNLYTFQSNLKMESSSVSGGVPSKKMKKFPTIIEYLQKNYEDVYDLFMDLGISGSLKPRRGVPGITFLVPDKKYILEIKKILESDDPEPATDMMFSLIIPDLIQSTEDWKKGEVGNLLSKKIVVTDIKKDKVLIKDGTVTLDKKFVPFERSGKAKRGNMAVWNLAGIVEFENAPEIAKVVPFKKKQVAEGGNEEMVKNDINEFKTDIEMATLQIQVSPMLDFVCSAIEYAKKDQVLYDKMRLIAYPNYIIVFELMFGLRDQYGLFTDSELFQLIKNYKTIYAKKKTHCDPIIFNTFVSDSEKLINISEIEDYRFGEIDILLQKMGPQTWKDLLKVYETVDNKNIMKYPQHISTIFQTNKKTHLALDISCYVFGFMCNTAKIINNAKKCISDIRTIFDKNQIISFDRLKNSINPTFGGKQLESFIRSSCCLRLPGNIKSISGGDEYMEELPGEIELEIEQNE